MNSPAEFDFFAAPAGGPINGSRGLAILEGAVMARIRTIKPEFWTDSKTGNLSDRATKLFLGLLNFSDDYGVSRLDLLEMKARIFPYLSGSPLGELGEALFGELLPAGLLMVFTMQGEEPEEGKAYLWVRNFLKHQRVDNPSKPLFPNWKPLDTPESYAKRNNLEFEDISANPRGVLGEHSGSPPRSKGREGKGREKTGEARPEPLAGPGEITDPEIPIEPGPPPIPTPKPSPGLKKPAKHSNAGPLSGETQPKRTHWQKFFAHFFDSIVERKGLKTYMMSAAHRGILRGIYDSLGPEQGMALWDLYWRKDRKWSDYARDRGHGLEIFASNSMLSQLMDAPEFKTTVMRYERELGTDPSSAVAAAKEAGFDLGALAKKKPLETKA